MPEIDRLRSVVRASSDPANPSPEDIKIIVESVRRVAVVGMSRDPTKTARRIPSYMATKGFDIVPVNPHAERMLGKSVHARLTDVHEPVDMVLLFRPSHAVGPFIREAAARPERPVIWLQEGIRDDRAASEAREAGSSVVQDLCFFKVHRALSSPRRLAYRGIPRR